MTRHFLTLLDFSEKEIRHILDLAARLKAGEVEGAGKKLEGKTLAMLFEKPSTRTRVSFEAGMTQMGGHAIYIDARTTQLGRGETVEDTARTLERYCDMIMARVNRHDDLEKMASVAGVPVINGLSDKDHPCQTIADLLTVLEKKGGLDGLKVAFLGDCGFNMFNSTMIGFSKMWANVVGVCPEKKEYNPDPELVEKAKKHAKGSIKVEHDPIKGIRDADVVYTDVWVSMGQENADQRVKDLKQYQVNRDLLKHAKPDALVMHCLPAHRGQEITSDVVDGPQSIVFDQAENRLHAQKAIMLYLLEGM